MSKILYPLLLISIFVLARPAYSQAYKSAVGLRLGYPASVTYKTFISQPGAIEVYGGFRNHRNYRYLTVGGMYLHHLPINDIDGLSWYVGIGANALFYYYSRNNIIGENVGVGANMALGLDLAIPNVPLNASIDWLPSFYFSDFDRGFGAGVGSVGLRYILK